MSNTFEFIRHSKLLVAGILFTGFLLSFGVLGDSKVYAACGAQGSIHDYAGAIIDVRAVRKDGSVVEVNNAVQITTMSPSYSGGNIVHLGNGPEGVDNRVWAATFNQINNNCVAGFGSRSIVLGYGPTSNGSDWALDCDISRRPGSDPLQSFSITGVGIPAGLDAPTADERAAGYGWTTQTIKPINGGTSYTAVIYKEPPSDPPPSEYEWDYDLYAWSDCTFVRGYSRLIWIRPDGVRQNIIPQYRVLYNGTDLTGWRQTGINGARDRNNPDSFRFIVNFGPGMGANIWGSMGGDRMFTVQTRFIGPTVTQGPVQKVRPVFSKNCANSTMNFNVSASSRCNRIDISGMSDGDRANVQYGYDVYESGAGGERGDRVLGPLGGTGQGNFSIPINPPEQNRVNNGYIIVVYAVDLYATGEQASPSLSREFRTGPCYTGSCTTSLVPNVPGGATGNAVKAGEQFTVNYTLSQNGQLSVPAGSFSLTAPPVPGWPGLDGGYTPRIESARSFTLTAPDTVDDFTISYYPDYWGYFPIGPACTLNIDVYKPYLIEPRATDISINPTTENPTTATFRSLTEKMIPPGVSIPNVKAERVITRNGSQIGPTFDAPNPYRAGDPSDIRIFPNDTVNVPLPNSRDDAYCGIITVFPAEGWIGPRDQRTVTVPSARDATEGCDPPECSAPGTKCGPVRVVNLPYVKSYGGDIVSGGGFKVAGGSCATPSAVNPPGIFAYIHPLGEQQSRNHSGSGGQLGAFAWGANISGFTTASMRTANPSSVGGNKLTFGNTTSGGSSQEPILGGNLTGDPPCLPDYFSETQYPDGTLKDAGFSPVDTANLTTNKQTIITGDTVINGANAYNKRHTVYIDGDASITGNIIYRNGGVTDVRNLPNFTLVVRGNIYVSRSVSRLDGTYIAQPTAANPNNTGRIFTCSDGFSAITTASGMFNLCGVVGGSPQLRVNGSFIAEKVILNRTIDSLRDSTYREPSFDQPGQRGTRAAEVFTFSPDVYLSPPVFRPKSTVTSGDYQYIATLPPIL